MQTIFLMAPHDDRSGGRPVRRGAVGESEQAGGVDDGAGGADDGARGADDGAGDASVEEFRRLYRPGAFFGLDFVLTWGPLWVLAAGRHYGWLADGFALLVIAGVSAMLSAVFFVHMTGSRRFVRDFWVRAVDPKRIGAVWWLVILFAQVAINIAAVLLSRIWGAPPNQLALSQGFLSSPLLFLGWILVFGPIPEELGWRGYGLDALRSRMNLLNASLLLGAIWAVWHLPLVFVEGSFQRGLLADPAVLVVYFFAFFPTSVLMSWVYYRTSRSTLSAILFHFSVNAAGELFHMGPSARVISMVIGLVFAAVVVWREWNLFSRADFASLGHDIAGTRPSS